MPKRLTWLMTAVTAVAPAFGSSVAGVNSDMQTAASTGFTLVGDTISNTGGPPIVSQITGSVGTPSSGGALRVSALERQPAPLRRVPRRLQRHTTTS